MISDYERGQIAMRERIASNLRTKAAGCESIVREWFLREAENIEGYLPEIPFRERLRQLLGLASYGDT
jgi:hypothetical protein